MLSYISFITILEDVKIYSMIKKKEANIKLGNLSACASIGNEEYRGKRGDVHFWVKFRLLCHFVEHVEYFQSIYQKVEKRSRLACYSRLKNPCKMEEGGIAISYSEKRGPSNLLLFFVCFFIDNLELHLYSIVDRAKYSFNNQFCLNSSR